MRRSPILVVALSGCQRIDAEEAQRVFTASYAVVADVESVATDGLVAANTKDLTIEGDKDGWWVSGTVEGGESWEGTVEVAGSANYLARTYSLELDTTFVDVHHGAQDVTMDGDVGLSLAYGFPDGVYTGAYTLEYGLSGELDVSGSAAGHAEIDYVLTVDFDGSNTVFDATGTIAGHAVGELTVGG